jgi:hypothetical protein
MELKDSWPYEAETCRRIIKKITNIKCKTNVTGCYNTIYPLTNSRKLGIKKVKLQVEGFPSNATLV